MIDFPSQDPSFWLSVVKELPHGWRLAYEQGPVSLRDNVEATRFPLYGNWMLLGVIPTTKRMSKKKHRVKNRLVHKILQFIAMTIDLVSYLAYWRSVEVVINLGQEPIVANTMGSPR